MNKLIIVLVIFMFGCNSSENKQASIIKQEEPKEKTVVTEEARILPKSEFEITNGGFGVLLLLGGSFDSIEYKFEDNFVDTLTMSSEGIDWKAKRINLGNGEWVLVEDNGGEGFISRLHTNSDRYKSRNGIFVGQKFSEVLKKEKNIGVDIDEGTMSIRLYGEGISISVDSISEEEFYKSSKQELNDIPKSATVDEIGIF